MKFCSKCGSQIQDNIAFCQNCGHKVDQIDIVEKKFSVKKKSNVKIPIIIGIVLIVVIVASVLFHGNAGYEKVIDTFYKSVETQNVKLMRSTLAQYWIDYQIADYDSDYYLIEDLEDIIEDELDEYECGSNVKITCSITNKRRANKEELDALKYNIYDWYAYYVYNKDDFYKSIKDAYVLTVKCKVNGNAGSTSFTSKILVIKENNKWKITLGYLDNSFYSN